MIRKLRLLIILLLLLAFDRTATAQLLQQSQNGSITVLVACNCQLTADKINQPLHFIAVGNVWRDTKRVRISSNCRWNLRVVSSKNATVTNLEVSANSKSKGKDKIAASAANEGQIIYTLRKTGGTGSLVDPSVVYVLGQEPSLPEGLGELELDVVFEMIVADPKKNPGNNNTWVSFYVLPKE